VGPHCGGNGCPTVPTGFSQGVETASSADAYRVAGGVYSNYIDEEDDGRIPVAVADNLEQLKRVKARYDPDNFFHANQNIVPD